MREGEGWRLNLRRSRLARTWPGRGTRRSHTAQCSCTASRCAIDDTQNQGSHTRPAAASAAASWPQQRGRAHQVLSLMLKVGGHLGTAVPAGPECGPCEDAIVTTAAPRSAAAIAASWGVLLPARVPRGLPDRSRAAAAPPRDHDSAECRARVMMRILSPEF